MTEASFKIHFLKSFWSDCILLEYDNKFALIDTGSSMDRDFILNYFLEYNIQNLEFLIITHFHCDHYGCVEEVLKNVSVKEVYIKEYSGLDFTKANGDVADDAYRKEEMAKYESFVNNCKKRGIYRDISDLNTIPFSKWNIKLFNTENKLKEVYENPKSLYYNQYKYNENYNSLAMYLCVFGVSIYLAGDLMDCDELDETMSFLNRKISQALPSNIAIYKSSHHGMNNGNSLETLKILNPQNIFVTNHEETIKNTNVLIYSQKNDCQIFCTDETVILEITDKGEVLRK